MGISTVQSYHGAQVFEAIGLRADVVERYFTGTASRIGGIGLDVIAEEARRRHAKGYPSRPVSRPGLDPGGEYRYRSERREPPLRPGGHREAAARRPQRQLRAPSSSTRR